MTIGHNSKAAITAELEEVKPVKTRKVLQIVCEVPMESADAALEALGGFPIPGQSRPVAIALLQPSEAPAETERPKGGPICKRAVMLCKNRDFIRWWMGWSVAAFLEHHQHAESLVKERMYRDFHIGSRAELDHNVPAAREFENVEREFYASQRGETEADLMEQRR